MVVFDTSVLLLLLDPDAGVPLDLNGDPVTDPKERIEYLVQGLSEAKTAIIIPTPTLSEALVVAGDAADDYLTEIERSYRFSIEAFDTRAAIEVAVMTQSERLSNERAPSDQTKAKVKYDRQIVGIAKARGAHTIYSDDRGLKAVAERNGLRVVRTEELPLPPKLPQADFFDGEQQR